jgi:hypothetical protein
MEERGFLKDKNVYNFFSAYMAWGLDFEIGYFADFSKSGL